MFRYDINGLRSLAVLAVLLFHFRVPGFEAGFIGVDVFYVISGFLMTMIVVRGLREGTFSFSVFYQHRAARLLPAFYTLIVTMLVLGALFVDPVAYFSMARSSFFAVAGVSNIFLFFTTKGYFADDVHSNWLLHTWSLSLEIQYFLVFPIIVSILHRFWPRHLMQIFMGGALASFALCMLFTALGGETLRSFMFYMLPTRIWQMLLGGLVFFWPKRLSDPVALPLELGGIVAILTSAFIFRADQPWPVYQALLPCLGTAAVIAAARGERSLVRAAPFQQIGNWSYSIYLWHWPLYVALGYFGRDEPLWLAGGFALSLFLGFLSYVLVESRTKKLLNPRGMVLLATSAAVLAGVCLVVRVDKGLVHRLAPGTERSIILDALAAKKDWAFPADCNARLCTVGATEQARTLVIGDSLGEMWYPRMKWLAERGRTSLDLMLKAGCVPIEGLSNRDPGTCGTFNAQVQRQMLSPRYDRIVMIAAWEGLGYKDELGAWCILKGSTCLPIDRAGRFDQALSLMRRRLDAAQAAGKSVTIVLQGPQSKLSVPDQVTKSVYRGEGVAAFKAYPEAELAKASRPVSHALAGMARPGVTLFNTLDQWCRNGRCNLMGQGDRVIFTDIAHLRADFARTSPMLDPVLADDRGNLRR